jgi:hypothetical protein
MKKVYYFFFFICFSNSTSAQRSTTHLPIEITKMDTLIISRTELNELANSRNRPMTEKRMALLRYFEKTKQQSGAEIKHTIDKCTGNQINDIIDYILFKNSEFKNR